MFVVIYYLAQKVDKINEQIAILNAGKEFRATTAGCMVALNADDTWSSSKNEPHFRHVHHEADDAYIVSNRPSQDEFVRH